MQKSHPAWVFVRDPSNPKNYWWVSPDEHAKAQRTAASKGTATPRKGSQPAPVKPATPVRRSAQERPDFSIHNVLRSCDNEKIWQLIGAGLVTIPRSDLEAHFMACSPGDFFELRRRGFVRG